jgi:hypothetical protein
MRNVAGLDEPQAPFVDVTRSSIDVVALDAAKDETLCQLCVVAGNEYAVRPIVLCKWRMQFGRKAKRTRTRPRVRCVLRL